MTPIAPHDLVRSLGGRYAAALGIDLARDGGERFKWLLAALLYGARISEPLATRTWREFAVHGVLAPQRIVDTGWDGLVAILDAGGYTRYDFKTATKLLAVCATLLRELRGIWNKAAPPLSPLALAAAQELGYLRHGRVTAQTALARLQRQWADDGQAAQSFADFEAALVREGLRLRHKESRRLAPFSRRREKGWG